MTRRQKIFLWILFGIHALAMYASIDGYYDYVLHDCTSWGASRGCPWGAESMGVAWRDPFTYTHFVADDLMLSFVSVVIAIFAIRKKQTKVAIWVLVLSPMAGFLGNILYGMLSDGIVFVNR